MKKLITLFVLCSFSLSVNVSFATLFTFGNGNIISDSETGVIKDHFNNREYLRLDILNGLTYQETLDGINYGIVSGYQIANIHIAQDFIAALLNNNSHGCSSITNFSSNLTCGFLNNSSEDWLDGALGDNYNSSLDAFFFYDEQISENNGAVLTYIYNTGKIGAHGYGGYFATDSHSNTGFDSNVPITWLMYKDLSKPVPEPSVFLLFGTGLFILSVTRRRKKFLFI